MLGWTPRIIRRMAERRGWTRDQLLLALRLYMRLPFGRLHGRNPDIIELASKIGRTPNALAMKACNFASMDPRLQERNIRGLSGASEADRTIWSDFANNSERLAAEAEEAFARLQGGAQDDLPELQIPTGPTDVAQLIRARRVQSFFRASVLTSYAGRCAVTDLAVHELLIASHIIPWSESIERRADPTNGICLNRLFDCAFDRGLMTVDESLRVKISPRLRDAALRAELSCSIVEADGRPLRIPARFSPDLTALEFHREHVFQS
jgi:putative restriction endonuclease